MQTVFDVVWSKLSDFISVWAPKYNAPDFAYGIQQTVGLYVCYPALSHYTRPRSALGFFGFVCFDGLIATFAFLNGPRGSR